MTKKEAFDYLKGTKVVLKTEDEQVKLQEFLFSIGYKWSIIKSTEVMRLYKDDCMFFIDSDGYISHNQYNNDESRFFGDTHIFKRLELQDILAIEIKTWRDIFKDVQDTLKDKQIMVISKNDVMIIDL